MADPSDDDDLLAVVAHSLLNSVTAISGNAQLLASHWDELDSERRVDILKRVAVHADHVSGVLSDLFRSGRPEVIEALEHLRDATDEGAT